MPGVVWSVGMHNVFKIALVVRREPLTITLSVEGCADLKTIVHFYSMRVTKFCMWEAEQLINLNRRLAPTQLSSRGYSMGTVLKAILRLPGNSFLPFIYTATSHVRWLDSFLAWGIHIGYFLILPVQALLFCFLLFPSAPLAVQLTRRDLPSLDHLMVLQGHCSWTRR